MSLSQKQLFLAHLAQTTDFPMSLEISRAEGVYMYSPEGKRYLDLISGISVSNIGHCNPEVVQAIKDQAEQYLHLMVYGEYVQSPQVKLAEALCGQLADKLNSVYLVSSGSEAIEGAMKLAKRHTGRTEIIAMHKAYHGSTQGALSIIGDESFRRAYRPLLPGIKQLHFNDTESLDAISERTAAVIVEPVQGEAGYIPGNEDYLHQLAQRCKAVGALLVFDEIQTGFGRTGTLFAHQTYGIVPDIITMAKGMGGGMPIGAFVANKALMDSFKNNPLLGHITTFGGHPVSAAAALASLNFILKEKLLEKVEEKSKLFRKHLDNPNIEAVRGKGLMLAIQLDTFDRVQTVLKHCLEEGVVSDWFLFCDNAIRLSPPLIISVEEIEFACRVINRSIEKAYH
jgi:acetylornithine/succinyldiaminopimelate/putrescine aminotransferase